MTRHAMTRTKASKSDGVGPELLLAVARQIPTLETDALARLLTSNIPPAHRSSRR